MNGVEQVLSQLANERFYGSVELKFEAGCVVLLRKTETIKPNKRGDRDSRGQQNERSY